MKRPDAGMERLSALHDQPLAAFGAGERMRAPRPARSGGTHVTLAQNNFAL
jgi:hypothetical protein